MEILLDSISKQGILVPLIVFKDDSGRWTLLDGERRWICAKKLNFQTVPVYEIPKPTKLENLLRMFNIHNVREEWTLLETAWKLEIIIDELQLIDASVSIVSLSEYTGLTKATVTRCKQLLSLDKKYQELIFSEAKKSKSKIKEQITEDFFIEMMRAVRAIERDAKALYRKLGGQNKIIDQFIEKQQAGSLRAVTEFRKIPLMLTQAQGKTVKKRVRKEIQRIVEEPTYEIDSGYEATVRYDILSLTVRKIVDNLRDELSVYKWPEEDRYRSLELKESLEQLIEMINSVLKSF